jgi:hypothetical protein
MARDPMPSDEEPAHDVLAAEAFAVPAPDPQLRHGPVELPDDPSGIAEPHDILAAEAFAMPVGRQAVGPAVRRAPDARRWAILGAAGLGVLTLLRFRRRGRG